jgi:hypothetical protein
MSRVEIHIGDTIGELLPYRDKDGNVKWTLKKSKIKKILELSGGKKIYTKDFYPLDEIEVIDTTELMRGNEEFIVTRYPFLVTPWLKEKVEKWLEKVNQESERVEDT